MKKKLSGLSKLLLLLPFMLLYVNSSTTCKAQVYYNITGENLQRIYGFAKQQSLDLFPQTLTTEYNNLVDKWNTLDTYLNYESIRWDYIADQLEFYLYNTYSGETATQYYGEDNLMVIFVPNYNNTISYNFYFIPYNWRLFKIIEETRTTSSGEVYFLHTLYENDINASGVAYKNMGVYLNITTSGEYHFYNDLQSFWTGIQSSFGSTYKTKYSYYKNYIWTYGYGILGLYNNNSTLNLKQKQIFYRPPNTSGNVPYQIWYNMNVNTNYVAIGDNFEEPTPTPEPTGDGGGGGVTSEGMTSGEFIAGQEDYWGSENDINQSGEEAIIENGINDIIGKVSGDIHSGEAINLIGTIEDGIKAIFHTNANDFKITWGTGYALDPTTGLYVPMIESGEINFSQMERENDTIAMVMTYIRTILNFAIIFALAKSAWNLLMDYLGVPEAKEELGDTTIADTVIEARRIYKDR